MKDCVRFQLCVYHQHLVSMLGCVTTTHEPMLVLEFCEKGDLLQYLHKARDQMNPLDEVVLLTFAFQASDGLVK